MNLSPGRFALLVLMNSFLSIEAASSDPVSATGQTGLAGASYESLSDSAGIKPLTRINVGLVATFAHDAGYILTNPFRWETSDWFAASLVAGTTAIAYSYDQSIQDWVRGHKSGTSNSIADVAVLFGDVRLLAPGLVGLYLYGYLSDDDRASRTALIGVESIGISEMLTFGLKIATHRHRPISGDPPGIWDGFSFLGTEGSSFPSGHATAAFSLATVVASSYKEYSLVPILSYSLATLTALSRVNNDMHWASDVIMGSAIGYFTAAAIVRLHDRQPSFGLLFRNDGSPLVVFHHSF